MDIRFIDSLIAVVEQGSIAAAARMQNITAAAVGQRIKALEQDLNAILLHRDGHKALPTAACRRFIPRAKLLLKEFSSLRAELDAEGLTGEFRIGAISSALVEHIPQIVQAFRERAPNAELKIIPGTSAYLFEELSEGRLDVAILVEPNVALPKHLIKSRIVDQRYAVIGDPHTQNPLIVYDRESWGGKTAWQWIEQNFAQHKILCELDSLETIIALVQRKMGFAVVPVFAGMGDQIDPRFIKTIEDEQIMRRIVLASPSKFSFPALLQIVEDTILAR